ncbi:MAG: hypothetical protein VKJ46_00940 [Leptolyngbyaceae bacterium]|nr:hypothetical protein [Leptolyngbyaceae bacterium]
MSTQDQARALASRHQHVQKNRQERMVSRAAAQVGLPMEGMTEIGHNPSNS